MPPPRTSSTSSTSPARAARSTRSSPLLLERGLAYRALTAEQAMTPRVDVDTVPATARWRPSSTLLRTSPHSRFPVVAQDVDDVVGVVGLAELLEVPRDALGERHRAGRVLRGGASCPGRCRCPPPWSSCGPAAASWRSSSTSSAGSTACCPWRTSPRRWSGDIFDEGDEREPEPPAGPADTHTLSARLRLDEVESSTGIRLPLGADYATVSGLVLGRLGRVAQARRHRHGRRGRRPR